MKQAVSFLLLSVTTCAMALSKDESCKTWQAMVDPSVHSTGVRGTHQGSQIESAIADLQKPNRDPDKVRSLSDDEILRAMSCLLALKGKRGPSRLAGVTNPDISQFAGRASVEVAALYYITYLFKGIFDHADAFVILNNRKSPAKDKMGALLTRLEDVSRAYDCYARWLPKVKKFGLTKARQQHLDPFEGTSLQWYGEHDP